MCKVVAYLVTDVVFGIGLSFISYQFYCYFYVYTEFVTTSPLISSTDLPTSLLSSLSGSIVSPTLTDTFGKIKSEAHTICLSWLLNFIVYNQFNLFMWT